MASLEEHSAARNDADLLARLVAGAEVASIPNPQGWAESHRGDLVAADIGDTTIADVHAYAVAEWKKVPRGESVPTPGADPSRVTDDQIKKAVQVVRDRETKQAQG